MPLAQISRRRGLLLALTGATVLAGAGGFWLSRSRESAAVALGDVCIVAPPTPYDPQSGVGIREPRPVPVDARCPVCGMFPARSPDWAAQVIFDNGDTHFFDSPLSLFTYTNNLGRYAAGRSLEQVVAQYVTNTVGGGWLPALAALFVDGSNAMGPMRAGNYPAFASVADAQHFASQRGGVVRTHAELALLIRNRVKNQKPHQHTSPA